MKENIQQSMNVEEQDKEVSNGEVTEVAKTPFSIVKMEIGYGVVLGREVLKILATKEACIKYIKEKPWELILNAAYLYHIYVDQVERKEKNTEEN